MEKFKSIFPYLLIALFFVSGVLYFKQPNASPYIQLSVDPEIHNDYGLAYPITYEFEIPEKSSELKAYKRYLENQKWQLISEKSNEDFFNGVEAARFDYSQNKAYISIGFSDESDKIQLKITNSLDKKVKLKYLRTSKYYDNRKAAIVLVADDWGLWGAKDKNKDKSDFYAAFIALKARNIWVTPAATTQHGISNSDWRELQEKIDGGYIEVAAHSRTHPSLPYIDYDSEIKGCMEDIINNLDLPYKKGEKEYVYAWIRPYGQGDKILRKKLGENKFLIDRLSCCYIMDDFTKWDLENRLYAPTGYSVYLEKSSLEEANQKFDEVINKGGIYSIYLHPYNNDFSEGSWQNQHFDYIKGHKDISYTGIGYLYLQHYLRDRKIINVRAIDK